MNLISIFSGFFISLLLVILFFVLIEGLFRFQSWFKRTFLIKEVSRKDFLAKDYHDYINRVEDWSKPMFFYFPIGFRLFNLDNPLPGRVENNSLGYRCPEFIPPLPKTKRIILLGGSAAWGSGSTDNSTTITGYLESYLNSNKELLGDYEKVECFNLAQLNGTQTQDILSLTFFAEKIKPNLILSFTGWNELFTSHSFDEELLKKFNMFYLKEMENWEPINVSGNKTALLKNSLNLWLKDKFEVARKILPNKRSSVKERLELSDLIANRSETFKEQLKILNRISKAYNAKHVQFFQPYLYRKHTLTKQEKDVIHLYDDLRPVHGGLKMGDYLRNNNIYEPMLDELKNKPKIYGLVHDLCDMFQSEKETKFFTLVHLTDSGYKDVAHKMINLL